MESVGSFIRLGIDSADDMSDIEATELHLGLPGTSPSASSAVKKAKRPLEQEPTCSSSPCPVDDPQQEELCSTPPAKSQIVGWPPVQAFRRNARQNNEQQSSKGTKQPCTAAQTVTSTASSVSSLVKVNMEGAPYLRKIDLGAYKGYMDLRLALDAMVWSSSSSSPLAQPNSMLTYEDKDGDWMLVGDVPWEMFTASCKRLRIVRDRA